MMINHAAFFVKINPGRPRSEKFRKCCTGNIVAIYNSYSITIFWMADPEGVLIFKK